MNEFKLYIGGRAVSGAATMEVINPATQDVVGICPRADEAQLNAAVAAAKAAFPVWAKTPITERRALLNRIADGIEARVEEIARLLTQEQGKVLGDSIAEVAAAASMTRALAALELETEVVKDGPDGKIVIHRTPLGVVAAITPWNVPILLLVMKAAPALMAGNTVVIKPAPSTPLTSLIVTEIANGVLPAGVINIICDENDLGALLTKHPDVAKVTFTGSTATGKEVARSGASTLKRVTLELGGNDAAIVLDGVDPKEVAPKVFAGAMVNSGQICVAVKRVYVPEGMYDEMCSELAKLAEAAVIGNGLEQGVQYGPLQNRQQYERVKGFLEDARRDGTIIAGGEAPEGPGYFIRPTIVRDIGDDSRLVREEQFGPVLPVLKYKSLEDAIARANDTTYGLGGTIWANDIDQGIEVAKQIDSGLVWVNQHMLLDPTLSTGGAKQSGMGYELGVDGLHEFTQQHVVYAAR